MKKMLIFILTLAIFSACNETETISIKTQTSENLPLNAAVKENINTKQSNFSFEKLISAQNPSKENLKWLSPNYKGLQLGKATQTDVIKTFGKPKEEFHPFSEYESTKHEWTFYYENNNDFDGSISFIFDIHSKILKVVWLRPNHERPLTIENAIEIYGNDYFVRGIGKSICSSKKLTKLEYPFTIVYPQKGIYFWVREGNQVDDIFYAPKCPQ